MLSVLLITLDADRLLDEVLRSVSWADEIVIVDGGSTDRTEEIARRYTDRFHFNPYRGHGLQRQKSLELARGDWIFYVDADEIVTPELRRSIERAMAEPGEAAGFQVQLHTWFLGRWLGRRGWRKEWKLRLFRRDRGRFDDATIHEGAIVDGPIRSLSGALLHYPYQDIAHFVEKMNAYSSAMAGEHQIHGHRGSPAKALVRGGGSFVRDFVFGGDFLNGGAGLVRSAMFGYYTFLKYAKIWEAETVKAPPIAGATPTVNELPEPTDR